MIKCWICEKKEANSDEHKFKASDIKRNLGKKFKAKFISNDIKPLNTYKDKSIKFNNILCIECNNNLTRPHDNAYDKFARYIEKNYETLFNQNYIDFEQIYGENWQNEKSNLYKYYAKHSGCRLKSIHNKIDLSDLSKFITEGKIPETFTLQFEIKEHIRMIIKYMEIMKSHKYTHMFMSPLIEFIYNESKIYGGWISYEWISINWVLSNQINQKKKIKIEKQIEPLIITKITNIKTPKNATADEILISAEYGKYKVENLKEHIKTII
ncbi:hypothetical protein LNI96_12020 [Tenacibaculum dicentrarchi]|uniref:HNH endonuclease n=1 Tax=Tenacibaculum dicentrarchi TaxID=669041 RepID=A0ABM9NXZ0_9FLAO|nr:hypothetical protein [Tenacibaculum dicentrarchi]SOS52777.1 conserved hypothetical protein [Tenacibaculum dicentrarchi]